MFVYHLSTNLIIGLPISTYFQESFHFFLIVRRLLQSMIRKSLLSSNLLQFRAHNVFVYCFQIVLLFTYCYFGHIIFYLSSAIYVSTILLLFTYQSHSLFAAHCSSGSTNYIFFKKLTWQDRNRQRYTWRNLLYIY